MPRWRSAAVALALLALGHPPVAVVGAVAQQYMAHLHGHAHPDVGRAAEHGHEHAPSVVEHGHEATTQARAGGIEAPALTGVLLPATLQASARAGAPAPTPRRGSGCDPPSSPLRNPVLRI